MSDDASMSEWGNPMRVKERVIDSVSSGERKRNSPNHLRVGFGPRCGIQRGQPRGLGRPAGEGDSPVGES